MPPFMIGDGHDAPDAARVPDADAYAALLRREHQLDVLQASLGWRLLSLYGPYKQRFVLPAWHALRRRLARWRPRAGDGELDAYERWLRFTDRFLVVGFDGEAAADLVSFVVVLDAAAASRVGRMVVAMHQQQHRRWELLMARVDQRSDLAAPLQIDGADPRIHVDPRVHESEAVALASLVRRAEGAIVGIVVPGSVPTPDAARAVARAFRDTNADVLYTDEDREDADGGHTVPRFLPGWSPDLLLSTMYWSRIVYYRRDFILRLLPFEPDVDGAQPYDLALRATERHATIVHVPRLLAHVQEATVSDSDTKACRAVERAVSRRRIDAAVTRSGAATFRVRRCITMPGKVSIIIPTRDGYAVLRRCLDALEHTRYADFDVVVIDNGSTDPATLALLSATRHRVLRRPGPFNFSRLNNDAVRETDGRYVLFLNDDTEPTDPDWLTALVEHAQRPEVGAVGAKLSYADGRIQHAGIAVGIGGIAGHPGRFSRHVPDLVRNVSAVTAACLMMRREVFDELGGFDEALPVNSNDVDLCLRLRQRGYLVVYTPYATVRHYESQTRGVSATADDAWLMVRRWRDVLWDDPYYSPNLDRARETGSPDLDKPDGWLCMYPGSPRVVGRLELAPGDRVSQRFFATAAGLAAVVVPMTVKGPAAGRAIRMVVEGADGAAPIREVEASIVGRHPEERWFCFEPIATSSNRFWRFTIEVVEGHSATVNRHVVASDVMGPCDENGRRSFGTLQFQLYARAPYRCAVS